MATLASLLNKRVGTEMYSKMNLSAKRTLLLAALATSAALLGGCQADMPMADDVYQPESVAERYPINVAKVPMKLEVASHRGGLQSSQVSAISNFARSASMASASGVSIRRPSGGGASATISRQVYDLLIKNGVAASTISQGTYRGSGNSPVLIAFTRSVAVTKECGDWSKDLGNTGNEPYPNFGCATQNNIAAMIQNPVDINVPRPVDPAYSATRFDIKELLK